ncbi:MAG: putative membrane protein YczE [Planctomycetota bacterium]|jgi:uncharacterized membrane protein YczE
MLVTVSKLTPTQFVLQFLRLQIGLFIFAFAISLMLEAHIGLDPWSTLHDGLSNHTGLTFGRVCQLTGLALILISALFLRVRPGLGTLFNMAVIGPWLDLLHVQSWFPIQEGGLGGVLQFVAGMLVMGIATGLYIGANFGAGPRDGFILGLHQRLSKSIRLTRSVIELTVLVAGWLFGGSLGLGTVLFALGMGPVMQTSLRLMHVKAPVRKPAKEAKAA